MASQVQIPFEGVILQEHSAPSHARLRILQKAHKLTRFLGAETMHTQCNSKPLNFEGHSRRLVAKKLIFLLVFLRVPSWSFVSLRGYFFPWWNESRRFLPLVRNAG